MKYILSIIFTVLVFNTYLSAQDDWQTEFEKSGFLRTPRYEETMAYFRKLEQRSPYAKMVSMGVSPQGRNINCLIVSKDKLFSAADVKKSGKPILMIVNGIHSGEIEGKDASMLLLRDILVTKKKEKLIDNVILLVVPIFNVDGHERFSAYNRINQNGPVEMGWRTTAQNYNLNRDWVKADAPEMQAMLKFYSEWLPDFFVDTHTTDGADYQYTLTYEIERSENMYAGSVKWINEKFVPFMQKRVKQDGFLLAPYINFKGDDLKSGLIEWPSPLRFSHGYTPAQNRPGLLVETHMMKPYKDRVFATLSMLNLTLEYVNAHPKELIELNKTADEEVVKDYAVDKKPFPIMVTSTEEHDSLLFKGLKWIEDSSAISGGKRITYTKEKYDFYIPIYDKSKVTDSVIAPYAYLIPAEWKEIAERLKLHGVEIQRLKENKTLEVEKYKFKNVKFQESSYEGRHMVNCNYDVFVERAEVPAGTFVVLTKQRTVRIILQALEPKGYDSFLRWGFFNSIFEPKEYFEDYVMEREAVKMLEGNPALKAEFEKKLSSDKQFRESPRKRLAFFYEKSPFFDKNLNVYSVMRVINKF